MIILWILVVILDIVKNEQGYRANFYLTIGLRIGTFVLDLIAYALFYNHRHVQLVVGALLIFMGTMQLIFGIIETDSLGQEALPELFPCSRTFGQIQPTRL